MANDDDYQRQLDLERDIEQEAYERQLRLQEEEHQRQLDAERQLDLEQELQERQSAQEQEDSQSCRTIPADHGSARQHRGIRGWNWRWARKLRDEDYRHVREQDERRWAKVHLSLKRQGRGGQQVILLGLGVLLFAGVFMVARTFTAFSDGASTHTAIPLFDLSVEDSTGSDIALAAPPESDLLAQQARDWQALTDEIAALHQRIGAIGERETALTDAIDTLQQAALDTQQTRLEQDAHLQKTAEQLNRRLQSLETLSQAARAAEISRHESLVQVLQELELRLGALQTQYEQPASNSLSNDAHTLPFQLTAIAFWNNTPYASVWHQGHTVRLARGESLAGWRLQQVDLAQQQAVFQNGVQQLAQSLR